MHQGALRLRFLPSIPSGCCSRWFARATSSVPSPGISCADRRHAIDKIHDLGGQDSIGFIGATVPRTKRTISFSGWLATFGTNNIDHHRTADYTGLVTALGDGAGDFLLTMKQLAEAKAVSVGNDPDESESLGCLADSQRNPAEWRETFHPERARYQVAAQGHAICEDGSVPGSSCDSLAGSRRGNCRAISSNSSSS